MTESESAEYEPWAETLRSTYARRESATFLLHDNVQDIFPWEGEYITCGDYVQRMLKRRDYIVILFDVSRGMRFLDSKDARTFLRLANAGRPSDEPLIRSEFDFPKESTLALSYIEALVVGMEESSRPVAILVDYAEQIAPSNHPAAMSEVDRINAVTLQRFSRLFYERLQESSERDAVLFLFTPNLHDLNPVLVSSELASSVRVPRPGDAERRNYITWLQASLEKSSDENSGRVELEAGLDRVVEQTAGLTLTGIRHIFLKAAHSGDKRLSSAAVMARKRELLERDSRGMLEVIEPRHGMDAVGGHSAIKRVLSQTAQDLKEGRSDVPVGIVCPGPNGVGKTFVAKAFAKDSGLNCVQIKNFRGMYVGQTEGNLDLLFSILRSMTPNVVIIDEADKMLGNEKTDGGSGVDDRVFGAFTAFMGDPEFRGKIFWLLLTARPFELAPDTGRPGRVEEHVPILPPETSTDRRQVLQAVARVGGVELLNDAGESPSDAEYDAFFEGQEVITPAAMQLVVTRARRASRRARAEEAGRVPVTLSELASEARSYVPDGSTAKLRLQTIEAVLYTNHLEYLPEPWRSRLRDEPDQLARERASLRAEVGYN